MGNYEDDADNKTTTMLTMIAKHMLGGKVR
jgi:hypothetical protein